jgi:hypothetical protein
VATSRQTCIVASTFALSIEVTWPLRFRATSKASSTILRISFDATCELADEDEIYATQPLRPERGGRFEATEELDGANVRKELQRLAHPEQPLLRANLRGRVVPLRAADRAEQDGVRAAARDDRVVRERHTGLIDGDAPDQVRRVGERVTGLACDRLEHLAGGVYDFGADSVAREKCDLCFHRWLPVRPAMMHGTRHEGND